MNLAARGKVDHTDRQTAGWLRLVNGGGFVPWTEDGIHSEEWLSENNKPLSLFDWMAWYAAGIGWEGAFAFADKKLDELPILGRTDRGANIFSWQSAREVLLKWLAENFPPEWAAGNDSPISPLWAITVHPKWDEAARAAWERYNRFQAKCAAWARGEELRDEE